MERSHISFGSVQFLEFILGVCLVFTSVSFANASEEEEPEVLIECGAPISNELSPSFQLTYDELEGYFKGMMIGYTHFQPHKDTLPFRIVDGSPVTQATLKDDTLFLTNSQLKVSATISRAPHPADGYQVNFNDEPTMSDCKLKATLSEIFDYMRRLDPKLIK